MGLILGLAIGAGGILTLADGSQIEAIPATTAVTPTTSLESPAAPPTTAATVEASESESVDGLSPYADEVSPLASFEVRGDEIVADGHSEDEMARAQTIWGRFVALIPAEHRGMVSGFELMGEDYEGAHVYPDDRDPTRWVLGVSEGLGADLDVTFVHEFGHLLTLNAREVPPNPNETRCRTFFTGEGCASPHSIVARFVDRFWTPELLDESDRIYGIEDEEEYWNAMDDFLARHDGEFVTEYAATNPGEDLAETFAEFILEERPDGELVKDRKVRFLWDDPALVELRAQIRDGSQ